MTDPRVATAITVLALGVLTLVVVLLVADRRRNKGPTVPVPPRSTIRNGDNHCQDGARADAPDEHPIHLHETMKRDLYPGMADTVVITRCPMVMEPGGGETPLRDWLKHFASVDAWPEVVSRFYKRAASDPEVADYFTNVDLPQLQRHFLATLMIITGEGINVGLVRRMRKAHSGVRNFHGRSIDEKTWNAVVAALANTLNEMGTPQMTIIDLAQTIEPLKAAIVVGPDEVRTQTWAEP